jgi:hypothetical protein
MDESDMRFSRENSPEWITDGGFTALGVNFNINQDKMITENFLPKIKSINSLWKVNNLTALGKIKITRFANLVLTVSVLRSTSQTKQDTKIHYNFMCAYIYCLQELVNILSLSCLKLFKVQSE